MAENKTFRDTRPLVAALLEAGAFCVMSAFSEFQAPDYHYNLATIVKKYIHKIDHYDLASLQNSMIFWLGSDTYSLSVGRVTCQYKVLGACEPRIAYVL